MVAVELPEVMVELVPTPVVVVADGQLVRSGPLLVGVLACVFDDAEGAGLAGAAEGRGAGVGAAKPCAKLTEPLAISRADTKANCFKYIAKLLPPLRSPTRPSDVKFLVTSACSGRR